MLVIEKLLATSAFVRHLSTAAHPHCIALVDHDWWSDTSTIYLYYTTNSQENNAAGMFARARTTIGMPPPPQYKAAAGWPKASQCTTRARRKAPSFHHVEKATLQIGSACQFSWSILMVLNGFHHTSPPISWELQHLGLISALQCLILDKMPHISVSDLWVLGLILASAWKVSCPSLKSVHTLHCEIW